MYGKVFESIYNGTLYGHWEALVTMQQLIVLADADGVVDMTPMAISARTSIPRDIIDKGLEILAAPDPYTRTPGSDGRRIALLDEHRPWGWFLINYDKYKSLQSAEEVRAKNRARKRKQRERDNDPDVTQCHKMSRHIDIDINIDTDKDKDTTAPAVPEKPADLDVEAFKARYPKRAGSQPWSRALKALHARLNDGHSQDELLSGADRYAAWCKATEKIGTEYVMQAATFYGPDKHFLSEWHPPANKSERRQDRNIEAALQFLETASGRK